MYYVDGELLLMYTYTCMLVVCTCTVCVPNTKAADNNGKLDMKSVVCMISLHHTLYSSCVRIVS